MRLDIDDGYTLHGETKPDAAPDPVTGVPLFTGLPVVRFKYRPALPVALAEYRMRVRRAQGGAEEVRAAADFLAGHLVEWDVTSKGQPIPPAPDHIRNVPEPILNQLVDVVAKWAPKADADRGN